MNLFHFTTTVILVMLGITLAYSISPERLKRAVEAQENPQQDERMAASELERRLVPIQSTQLDRSKRESCPPGVWTCLQSHPPAPDNLAISYDGERASSPDDIIQGPSERRSPPIISGYENDNAELDNESDKCPPGIWVCGKKKRSELMKKLRRALQRF